MFNEIWWFIIFIYICLVTIFIVLFIKRKYGFKFKILIVCIFLILIGWSYNFFDFKIYENRKNSNINIRQQSNIKSKVIGSLKSGNIVLQLKSPSPWSMIFLINKGYGFVYHPLLSEKHVLGVKPSDQHLLLLCLLLSSVLFHKF